MQVEVKGSIKCISCFMNFFLCLEFTFVLSVMLGFPRRVRLSEAVAMTNATQVIHCTQSSSEMQCKLTGDQDEKFSGGVDMAGPHIYKYRCHQRFPRQPEMFSDWSKTAWACGFLE